MDSKTKTVNMKGWTEEAVNAANAKSTRKAPKKVSAVQTQGEGRKTGGKVGLRALGRMKAGKMNKTEAAYAQKLEVLKQTGKVLWYAFDQINLRIAEKCFYKVDFFVMTDKGELEAHEVKGKWEDDALVKIKVAAAIFPFRFIAVRLVKGSWETREF